MKNAHLEALGNSQNNPGTRWNLAVQLPLVNSTIQYNPGRVRNFPRGFQATVQNKLGTKFSRAKKPQWEIPPPLLYHKPPPPPNLKVGGTFGVGCKKLHTQCESKERASCKVCYESP